jgi:hypothetical protein
MKKMSVNDFNTSEDLLFNKESCEPKRDIESKLKLSQVINIPVNPNMIISSFPVLILNIFIHYYYWI